MIHAPPTRAGRGHSRWLAEPALIGAAEVDRLRLHNRDNLEPRSWSERETVTRFGCAGVIEQVDHCPNRERDDTDPDGGTHRRDAVDAR